MKQYQVRNFPNFINELEKDPQYANLPKPLSGRQFKNIMKSYGYDVEVHAGSQYGLFYMDDVTATLFILKWL